MKLLWLTPEVPEPGGTGGALRAFHLLGALAVRGWELTVASVAYPEQAERARPLFELGVDLRLARRPGSQPAEAAEALLRDPALAVALARDPWLGWQAGAFWTRLGPIVGSILASKRLDAVVVEHDFAARWAAGIPRALPLGLAYQNAGWTMAGADPSPAQRVDGARFVRYLRRFLGRYEWSCAVSDDDADQIAGLGVPRPTVIPNGVDFARVAGIPDDAAEPGALLFTGTMTYPPNAEAAVWLAREVLPRLRPDVDVRIIGRNPPANVQRLAEAANVTVTGWVDDLAPELARAAVVVAPLRSGGGTKLKVIEALAAGRPVVATTVGAEGIEVADGEHLLVADAPEDFAAAIERLLADPMLAARLARAGRERMRERYDWDALGGQLDASLRKWLA